MAKLLSLQKGPDKEQELFRPCCLIQVRNRNAKEMLEFSNANFRKKAMKFYGSKDFDIT